MRHGRDPLDRRNNDHEMAVEFIRTLYSLGGSATSKQISEAMGHGYHPLITRCLHEHGHLTRDRKGPYNLWTLQLTKKQLREIGVIE